MLDFTSSLYLDLQHPASDLPTWKHLTTGKPLALYTPPGVIKLSQRLAVATGSESAFIGKSTLHLYWDILVWLNKMNVKIYCDEFAYPTSSWLISCFNKTNCKAHTIPHHNVQYLRKQLESKSKLYSMPIMFADGYSPLSGKIFPLQSFLPVLKKHKGLLILDDTQNMGIYGRNGGGIKFWYNIDSQHIILISSLAKALGVPMAVLCANRKIVNFISDNSFNAMHSSPVSNDLLLAANHALDINEKYGSYLRNNLLSRIKYFIRHLGKIKQFKIVTNHPFQTFVFNSNIISIKCITFLKKNNILGIHHQYVEGSSAISIILRTSHQYKEILHLANILNQFYIKYLNIMKAP